MGTRASIQFKVDDEIIYIYRGHDGYPDGDILPDLNALIEKARGRWSEPEPDYLVTLFLAMFYDFNKTRLPDYTITSCVHGDEEYVYLVEFDRVSKEWSVTWSQGRADRERELSFPAATKE